jgi:type IV pilus assembly protein PilB
VLAVLGFLTEVDVARAVAKQFGLPYMDPTRYQVPKEALESVPVDLMRQNQFIVLDRIGRTLVLAVAGVLNGEVLEKVEKVSGCQAFVYVATPAQVQQALDKHLAPKAAKAAPKAAGPIPGRK